MKRILSLAILVASFALGLGCLGACTTAPPGSAASASHGLSFNDQLAYGYSALTVARNTAADLLTTGQISIAQATRTQTACDAVQAAIDGARALASTDPATAQASLTSALLNLADVQASLVKKGSS